MGKINYVKVFNALYSDFLESNLKTSYTLDFSNGVTEFIETDSAFSLNNPSYPSRTIATNKTLPKKGLICRMYISYANFLLCVEDEDYGKYILSLYKNEALNQVYKKYNEIQIKHLTFKMPPGTIILERMDLAAYEIRLYVEFNKESDIV